MTASRRGDEDGNAATQGDPTWTPLHPTTPAHPTYSGNAATVGFASATVLDRIFQSDAVSFDVHWDAYGFPGVTRSYVGFAQAAQEEADSRIYGGIHFRFDSVAGQQIGTNVGRYVLRHELTPADGEDHGRCRNGRDDDGRDDDGRDDGDRGDGDRGDRVCDALTGAISGRSILGTGRAILA